MYEIIAFRIIPVSLVDAPLDGIAPVLRLRSKALIAAPFLPAAAEYWPLELSAVLPGCSELYARSAVGLSLGPEFEFAIDCVHVLVMILFPLNLFKLVPIKIGITTDNNVHLPVF